MSDFLFPNFRRFSVSFFDTCWGLFFQGWKGVYIKQHKKLAEKVSTINHFVKDCSQNESIEISDYLKAVAFLGSAELGFEDVKLFLFTENTNVLMNLIGVHYSIFCLQIPVSINENANDDINIQIKSGGI